MRLINMLGVKVRDVYSYFLHDNVSYIIDIAYSLFCLGVEDIFIKSINFNMSLEFAKTFPNYFMNL